MTKRKEGNDQESVQLPSTFRSKTPKGKKDALKVTAPQSKHYKQKAKRAIRLVQTAKTDQHVHLHSLSSVFADPMCLLQPQGYSKRDKREPLPNWVAIQTDLSHTGIILGFVMC